MKKVLCFGDSNVFGFNPKNGTRYPKNVRWSGLVQELCAQTIEIVEAGCNNRTCFKDNPAGFEQTGYKVLPSLLVESFACVVVAIGINDLQFQYNSSIQEIEKGINDLILLVKQHCPDSKILLLAPSQITQNILNSFFNTMFDESSIEKSKLLATIYQQCALKNGCDFLDLDEIANVSKIDGLHYDASEHEKIAKAVWGYLKGLQCSKTLRC